MIHHIGPATRLRSSQISLSSSFPIRQLIYWSTYIRCETPIHPVPEVNQVCPYTSDKFSMATVDEVHKCVVKSTSKSCDLNPLPGYITRNALGKLIPFSIKIINTSLQSGQMRMPSQLKVAKLHALYFTKEPSLNHTQFLNYRPVSILTFISRAIEKSFANQLISYINKNKSSTISVLGISSVDTEFSNSLIIVKGLNPGCHFKSSLNLIIRVNFEELDTISW